MNRLESYLILGLQPLASKHEIRDAFRTLAKRLHPDSAGIKGNSHEFGRVVSAYNALTREAPGLVHFPDRRHYKSRPKPAPGFNLFTLGNIVIQGKTKEQRVFAVRSLGNSGQKGAYAFLRKALFDEKEQVVIEAVTAVGRLKVLQSAGELSSVFTRGSVAVKQAVLDAVEKVGLRGGFNNLVLQAMEDPHPDIRRRGLKLFLKKQE